MNLTEEQIKALPPLPSAHQCFAIALATGRRLDYTADDMRAYAALAVEFALASAATPAAQAVPDGWKLVPVEPTADMVAAMERQWMCGSAADMARREWRAGIAASPPAPAQRPTDDALWDQTLRERDYYHDWADKLAAEIGRFFGFDIGEHSNVNNPWACAFYMVPRGTLAETIAASSPTAAPLEAEPVAWSVFVENKNLRIWSPKSETIERLAAEAGLTITPLYTHPPARPAAPPAPAQHADLTDDQVADIAAGMEVLDPHDPIWREFAHLVIEAIKSGGAA